MCIEELCILGTSQIQSFSLDCGLGRPADGIVLLLQNKHQGPAAPNSYYPSSLLNLSMYYSISCKELDCFSQKKKKIENNLKFRQEKFGILFAITSYLLRMHTVFPESRGHETKDHCSQE